MSKGTERRNAKAAASSIPKSDYMVHDTLPNENNEGRKGRGVQVYVGKDNRAKGLVFKRAYQANTDRSIAVRHA